MLLYGTLLLVTMTTTTIQTEEEAVRAHFSNEACDVLFAKFPATFFGGDADNEDLSVYDYESLSNLDHRADLLKKLEERLETGYSSEELDDECRAYEFNARVHNMCQTRGFRILKTDPVW